MAVAAAIFLIRSMEYPENVSLIVKICLHFHVFFFPRFNFLSAASLCQFLLDSLMCFIFNFHAFIPDGRGELWSRALARYEANTVYVSSSHRTLCLLFMAETCQRFLKSATSLFVPAVCKISGQQTCSDVHEIIYLQQVCAACCRLFVKLSQSHFNLS